MIVFIGRQNAGKSTLFNRLVGSGKAVVSAIAGTTIDRKKSAISWQGKQIQICDMAGLPIDKNSPIAAEVNKQAIKALDEASEIVLIIDGLVGITQDDINLIAWIRKQGRHFSVVINKIDNPKCIDPILTRQIDKRFGKQIKVLYLSALHGKGVGELLDYLSNYGQVIKSKNEFKIVICGRQNTGKSTLFNAFLKQERSVVSGIAGTTRDAVEEHLTLNGENIMMIDTAGIRKQSKINELIEKQSTNFSLRNIETADVVICLVDAKEGPTQQDIKIINHAQKMRKNIIIAVNKWDLIEADESQAVGMILSRFSFLQDVPIIPISAKDGWNINKLITALRQQLNRKGV